MDSARRSRLLVLALSAAAVTAVAGYGYTNKERLDAEARLHARRVAQGRMAAAVQAAALQSDSRAVRAMLQRPDASAATVGPAVVAAAAEGDAAMVRLLLDACPAARGQQVLNAALARSCSFGYADVARVLLARGAQPDARDGLGFPLIVRASSRGHAGVVRALLDAGADPNAAVEPGGEDPYLVVLQDSEGITPLLAAAARGNPATVRILLQRGASVRARSDDGQTAIGLCRSGRTFWSGKRGFGSFDPPARAVRIRKRVAGETNCLEVEELLRKAGCAE